MLAGKAFRELHWLCFCDPMALGIRLRCDEDCVWRDVLSGTNCVFDDNGLRCALDFRDMVGSVDNQSRLLSRSVVVSAFDAEVHLISSSNVIIALSKTFFNVAFVPLLCSFEPRLCAMIAFMRHCFHFCLNSIWLGKFGCRTTSEIWRWARERTRATGEIEE